jgi:hypothetical protein
MYGQLEKLTRKRGYKFFFYEKILSLNLLVFNFNCTLKTIVNISVDYITGTAYLENEQLTTSIISHL